MLRNLKREWESHHQSSRPESLGLPVTRRPDELLGRAVDHPSARQADTGERFLRQVYEVSQLELVPRDLWRLSREGIY